MRPTRELLRIAIACGSVSLLSVADADAQTAAGADDICPPATNPCVIGVPWDVTGPLDFGLRSVRVTGNGRLRGQPDVLLTCGDLVIDTGATIPQVIEADGNLSGDVTITAYRACSGDGVTPCLSDTVCATASVGTCSVGSGTVLADGKIASSGGTPGTGTIHAAGNIAIGQRFNFGATAAASDGGAIDIESFMGTVTTTALLLAKSGQGGSYGYYGGNAGEVSIRATGDITIGGGIDVWGRLGGGTVLLDAGRDVTLTSDVIGSGGGGGSANGGHIHVTAGRDIAVVVVPNGDPLQDIETDGGTDFYFYGYGGGGSWYSGYGGYQYLIAGEDIAVGQTGRIHSNGGRGAGGGSIYFDALGRVDVEGEVRAQGTPPSQGGDTGAGGGWIELTAGQGIRLGEQSILATASPVTGGNVILRSDSPIELYGLVDVRGTGAAASYNYSFGGNAVIEGVTDVLLSGAIQGGGAFASQDLSIDVCRLTLDSSGRIQNMNNPPNEVAGHTYITVRESMTTAKKSKLIADTVGGGTTWITYRDPAKPPLLAGTMTPTPILAVNPGLVGCPVCGNTEIDQGESCDDGNAQSGDGCRSDCQDEGCIADSPGFPGTPLCDDADACTLDVCDPLGHSCSNIVSCDEGVACTLDSCVAGACEHVADDTLCNDRNDCTDDVCNATTGCVHANLTGGPCEDGDFCTVTGSCSDGDCLVIDVSRSTGNRINVKVVAGVANDIMKIKASLALVDFTANPTLTGMRLVVVDAFDTSIYEAVLGAADWEDPKGQALQFRFVDSQGVGGPANGVAAARVKRIASKGVAKVTLRMKGGEVPGAAGQSNLSFSLLFGTDPAVDECTTARRVACKASATKTSCRD